VQCMFMFPTRSVLEYVIRKLLNGTCSNSLYKLQVFQDDNSASVCRANNFCMIRSQ
jgi:hypothetical protein